jgi:hypothetical protein
LISSILEKGSEIEMNKLALTVVLALVFGLSFLPIEAKAQMGPGCGYGYGMGPGMMGPGYGYQYGPQYQQPQKSLDEKDAKTILENYLKSTRNPNLKLGKIEDKGNAFEGEVLTQKGSLVDKILIDKNTGWMRSVY